MLRVPIGGCGNLNMKQQYEHYVEDFYNKLVKKEKMYGHWKWFKSPQARTQYLQTLRTLHFVLKDNYDNALEIGCGDGFWTRIMAQLCGNIDAIDVAKNMITTAKDLTTEKNIYYIHNDFMKEPFQKNNYELIYGIRCIEYITQRKELLHKIYSLLKENGTVLFITKNPRYFRMYQQDAYLHSHMIETIELEKLLRDTGFENVISYPAVVGTFFKMKKLRAYWQKAHGDLLQDISHTPFTPYIPSILTESYLTIGTKI
jgi:ubiquinone/menaquinone biosynthesis C-methylase UbiE